MSSLSVALSKKTKMSDLINYRLRITTIDNRNFVGSLLAFDKHFNVVLSDTEESRVTNKSFQELKRSSLNGSKDVIQEKRSLGLTILRGDQIVSLNIESSPPLNAAKRLGLQKGKGVARPLKTPISVKGKVGQSDNSGKTKTSPGFSR